MAHISVRSITMMLFVSTCIHLHDASVIIMTERTYRCDVVSSEVGGRTEIQADELD